MHTMTSGRAIDGDEPLFDLEGFEGIEPLASAVCTPVAPAELLDLSHIPHFSELDLSSFSTASTPAEVVNFISQIPDDYERSIADEDIETFKGKGKAVSQPMDILPPIARDSAESHFDLFSFSAFPISSNRKRRIVPGFSSPASSPHTPNSFPLSPNDTPRSLFEDSMITSYATDMTSPRLSYASAGRRLYDGTDRNQQRVQGKGKSRAEPPVLPPLSFSPTEFTRGETSWPIEGAISFDASIRPRSLSSINLIGSSASSVMSSQQPGTSSFTSTQKSPSRTRSFPSFSVHPTKSHASRSARSIQVKGKRHSNLARRLLLQHDIDCDFEQEENVPASTPVESAEHERYSSFSAPSTPYSSVLGRIPFSTNGAYKVPVATAEKALAPDLFERILPKEIKLRIFQDILYLYEVDGKIMTQLPTWTALKATKEENRWVGKEKGYVELVRNSRVCKSWSKLVFDGQLWANIDLRNLPQVPPHFLLRLASSSGSFVRSIDFTGHTRLTATSLLDITSSFCIRITPSDGRLSTTQLTDINLSGCSAITIHALHDILVRSPLLVKLNLKGMSIVTNETCRTVTMHCPSIISLDLSCCHNMDADGIILLISPHQGRRSALKALRLSGLKRVSDRLLSLLGRYVPDLEVLNLNGARELHNTALEAFVACAEGHDSPQEVILTSREAGRDPSDPTKYRRRVTNLRHLSLSHCPLLSDVACSYLAHALPKLEFLELAGIGSDLRDEGLVHLLSTTPLIRRLDLDEACDITDATITALTPQILEGQGTNTTAREPWTGSQLEQLTLSYAVQLTNDALLSLVRACPKLKRLDLDNTRVSGTTVKEFVRLSRKRQIAGAGIAFVDCRGVGENAVKDLVGSTRTRNGWRGWEARHLHYLDARDDEGLGVGTDECDEKRVVLKSFYSWQTVDAVEAARAKQRKANKKNGRDSRTGNEEDYFSTRRSSSKWWSPGARRASGSPVGSSYRDRDSCTIM
ncbi:hypothetical protein EW145_g956 [Phellinidium pouzarii]|uniref:F-box domain-containing protein n=1 Tax=Phellinidium pouzarii TaxID=167371 RepID=A0A4S4LGX6_9AGAM|nr:hypothetical protein EW145_g956 [Phellinidium pouzarii]